MPAPAAIASPRRRDADELCGVRTRIVDRLGLHAYLAVAVHAHRALGLPGRPHLLRVPGLGLCRRGQASLLVAGLVAELFARLGGRLGGRLVTVLVPGLVAGLFSGLVARLVAGLGGRLGARLLALGTLTTGVRRGLRWRRWMRAGRQVALPHQ